MCMPHVYVPCMVLMFFVSCECHVFYLSCIYFTCFIFTICHYVCAMHFEFMPYVLYGVVCAICVCVRFVCTYPTYFTQT